MVIFQFFFTSSALISSSSSSIKKNFPLINSLAAQKYISSQTWGGTMI